jgi:hypothetical protein
VAELCSKKKGCALPCNLKFYIKLFLFKVKNYIKTNNYNGCPLKIQKYGRQPPVLVGAEPESLGVNNKGED